MCHLMSMQCQYLSKQNPLVSNGFLTLLGKISISDKELASKELHFNVVCSQGIIIWCSKGVKVV